ncbi:MAG: tetratricopeptide (TPR) repeat protein [Verrucomicrobiales bacterium]|jgi:tetratricopeptide (TPR) repeat protein
MIAQLKNCTACGSRLNGSVAGLGSVCPSCIVRAVRTPCVSHADTVSEDVDTTTWADVFPQFRIERVLRKSDETPVYLARVEDEEPRKRVVIQIVTGTALEEAGGVPALTVRARKLAAYSFDGLLPVLDFGDLSDAFFLATEARDEPLVSDALAGADCELSADLLAALDSCGRRLTSETSEAGVEFHADPILAFGDIGSGICAIHFTPSVLPAGPSPMGQSPPSPAAFTAQPDAKLGPFVLEEKLGEGGFGEVWRARQQHPAERQVALKILKQGLHSSRARARFDLEQAALARLDHPNIARLYEAGTTSDGRPFFAMEWVDGTTLNRLWKDGDAPLDRRLELFAQVCRAVEHAHLKGILHRDLKPSNVMVATDGESVSAKVIDFGIARALEDPGVEQTLLTRPFDFMGTPVYMSPEQIAAIAEADARSDVYSLGVTLYEALCAQLPFDPKLPLPKLQRAILDDEPLRPSQRFADQAQARWVRGDLDWITLKCLEKDPARRYQSVGALLLDIERHAKNEAVDAGPPEWSYRVGKFVRRNRGGVAAAVGLFLVLVGVTLFSHRQKQAARAAEALASEQAVAAQAEKQKSDRIADFLLSILKTPQYERSGPEIKVVELLDQFVSRLRSDKTIPPESQAPLWRAVVDAYSSASLLEPAIDLASESLRFHEEFLGPDHPGTLQARVQWAYSYRWRGNLSEAERLSRQLLANELASLPPGSEPVIDTTFLLAGVLHNQYRIEEEVEVLRAQIALLPVDRPERSKLQLQLAGALSSIDRADEAIRLTKEVVTRRRGTLGNDHPQTLLAIVRLARVHTNAHQHEDTVAVLEPDIPQFERVFGPEHQETLEAKRFLSVALHRVGRTSEALPMSKEVMTACQRVFGPDHRLALHAMGNHAFQLSSADRLDEARTLFETALAKWRAKRAPPYETLHPRINLIGLYVGTGETKKALALTRELRESLVRNHPPGGKDADTPNTPDRVDALPALPPALPSVLGHAMAKTTDPIELPDLQWMASWHPVFNLLQGEGEYDLAVPLTEGYLRALYRRIPQEDKDHRIGVENLAFYYSQLQRWEDAVPVLQVAIRMTDEQLGPEHPRSSRLRYSLSNWLWKWEKRDRSILILECLDAGWQVDPEGVRLKRKLTLGESYRLVGQPQVALDILQSIRPQLIELYGWEDPSASRVVREVARCYEELGRFDAAIRLYREAIPILEGLAEGNGPDLDKEVLNLYWHLGLALNLDGQYREALEILDPLIPRMEETEGVDPKTLLAVEFQVAKAHYELGEFAQAAAICERLLPKVETVEGPDGYADMAIVVQYPPALFNAGRREEAIEVARKMFEVRSRVLGADHFKTQHSKLSLGVFLNATGGHEEAVRLLEELLLEIPRDAETPWKPNVMHTLAEAYRDLDRTEEEARMRAERRRLTLEYLEEAYAKATSDPERTAKVVISQDSTWRWNRPAQEKDAGIAARFAQPDYDDSGWSEAADSRLGGFGCTDAADGWIEEVEVGNPHPDGDHPHAPAFFRHRFTTTKAHEHLELIVQMDDGAVVFLDGFEVGRENVRSGEDLANLYAVECENPWIPRRIPLEGRLEPGEHVLAISVHSHDCLNHDIRIAGIELVSWTGPAPDSRLADEPLADPEPGPFNATEFAKMTHGLSLREIRQADKARAREALVLSMIGRILVKKEKWPGSLNGLVKRYEEWCALAADEEAVAASAVLIERGAGWKFHPCDAASAVPAGWSQRAFDDSPWASGAAPLGYGDKVVVGEVADGEGPAGKPRTVLFRRTFMASSDEVPDVVLGNLRADDGAAVYVNGQEVQRLRLPEGSLDPSVFATESVSSESSYVPFMIPATAVRPGENVLAVEVHQVGAKSSDVIFDLELQSIRIEVLWEILSSVEPSVALDKIRRTYELRIQDVPTDWRERVEARLTSLRQNRP